MKPHRNSSLYSMNDSSWIISCLFSTKPIDSSPMSLNSLCMCLFLSLCYRHTRKHTFTHTDRFIEILTYCLINKWNADLLYGSPNRKAKCSYYLYIYIHNTHWNSSVVQRMVSYLEPWMVYMITHLPRLLSTEA